MKKLGKLKLNQLSKADLKKKEMNTIKGGVCGCFCTCVYSGEQCSSGDSYYGGSSIDAKGDYNAGQISA